MVDGFVVDVDNDVIVIVAGGNIDDADNPNNLQQFNGFIVYEKAL